MSLSLPLLQNIKTHESSDEDEEINGHALLEVLGGFPEVVHERIESNINEQFVCDENVEDPLEDRADDRHKFSFTGEYVEEDFLCDDNNESNSWTDTKQDKTKGNAKRARLTVEVKGQNGTKWSTTQAVSVDAIKVEEEILTPQPSGKGPAVRISRPLEAWLLLLDEPILMDIVRFTNDGIKIRKLKAPYQRATDIVELRAWLGLNYLCGLFRNSENNGPLEELWTLELGISIFRAAMSLNRFIFLAECLRCSDPTRKTRPFTEISHIWEKFITNCRSYYAPGAYCVVDELLLTPVTDANASQPRLMTLCDAKTQYLCNAVLTCDTMPRERDVLQLVSDIKNTKRNVIMQEHYTSLSLAQKLYKSQLTSVGALNPIAAEVPCEVYSTVGPRRLYSGTATLTCGLGLNESPTGLLLSNGLPTKMHPVKIFRATSGCCQRFQTTAKRYSTRQATPTAVKRLTLEYIHTLLDFAAVNSWTLLRLSREGDGELSQRDFLRQLGMHLTQQHLKRRLQYSSKLTLMQKLQLCEILGEPTEKILCSATEVNRSIGATATMPAEKLRLPDGVTLMPRLLGNRVRCRNCPRKKETKTRYRCQQCLRPLCARHFIWRCAGCTGVPEMTEEEPEGAKNDASDEALL